MDIFKGFLCGLRDSFKGLVTISNLLTVKENESFEVLRKVGSACGLNGAVFLLSLLLFEKIMSPLGQHFFNILFVDKTWADSLWNVNYFIFAGIFYICWILPLFLLSRIINAFWFQDIADTHYKLRKGRLQSMGGISKIVADLLLNIVVQALFLCQIFLLSQINYFKMGQILSFVHMCFLYSLYSFEYKWFNMGWELHKRLTFVENNWPYFLGFGAILSIATSIIESFWLGTCVFSTLFPLLILSGNESTPSQTLSVRPFKIFYGVIKLSNLPFSKAFNKSKKK